MNVLFAPDYRRAVPYQQLLADALTARGIRVEFISGYRRLLPIYRAVKASEPDVLHLHWPEEYFLSRNPAWSVVRQLRYPLDLFLTTRSTPLVITAHDLFPHNLETSASVRRSMKRSFQSARAVIVHSQGALDTVAKNFGMDSKKMRVIPHGDLSTALGAPIAKDEASAKLGLGESKLCLMFGTIEPYKGIEPVIEFWRSKKPAATLAIVGKPVSGDYGRAIRELAAGAENIIVEFGFQPEEKLKLWLSAADAVIFNYRFILTSGAACLARSWGVPILVPHRLITLDLQEPHPLVIRFNNFESDFAGALDRCLLQSPSYEMAAAWRESTRWDAIAEETAKVYEATLN